MEGAGALFKGAASDVGEAADSTLSDAVDSCGLSFRADTLVATPKGEQAIGTLNVGSKVQAYNPATKTTSTQAVQQIFINHDTDLIDVTLAVHPAAKQTKSQRVAVVSHGSHAPPVTVETVHTTQKHPWLTTKGWIMAGQLRLGDQVQELNGTTATVIALKVIPGAADMYDLTISNVHTFAVGIGQFVVHNCGDGPRDPTEIVGSNPRGRAMVRLYRAVDSGEYANIAESGEFSMEGGTGNMQKYFAPTPEEAIAFGNKTLGRGNFGLVTGEFPYEDIIAGNNTPWPGNVITGVIHNGSIREVGIPGIVNSMLDRFQNIRLLGFGFF